MTIDVALAALTVAFALCAETGPRWKVLAVLTCAALTKEQALPMIAGYTLYLVTRRRFLDGVWAAMTALPAVAWFVYLAWRTPPAFAPPPERGIPFAGMVDAILHPLAYSFTPFKNAVGVTFDYIALAGFTIALVFTVRLLIQRRWDAQASAIYVLAAAALVVRNWVLWTNAYAFGRGFTPFLLLVALQDLGRRPWLALLPMLLVDARIGLNFIPQVMGVARGLSGL